MHVNKAQGHFCNENDQRKRLIGEKKVITAAWQIYDDDWCFHKHPSLAGILYGVSYIRIYIVICIVHVHTNGVRVQESEDEASLFPDI